MYKLAIFDLDGTLLNTLGDLHAAVNHALNAFGFPERSITEVRSFIGNGVKKLMERSTPDGTDEETNSKCLDVFRKHYLEHMSDSTAPYDTVSELICELREQGIKIAVVSNKLHEAVVGLCDDYFPNLIDEAIGVSKEEERKPNPVNTLKAMDIFRADKNNTIYIGDSEVDVQTAHNSGIECIGVTWGFRDREDLILAKADYIADSAEEVLKIITA